MHLQIDKLHKNKKVIINILVQLTHFGKSESE